MSEIILTINLSTGKKIVLTADELKELLKAVKGLQRGADKPNFAWRPGALPEGTLPYVTYASFDAKRDPEWEMRKREAV